MAELLTVESLIALLTLIALEIVLGIDNIVFIAILTGRLPEQVQPRARRIGLMGAMLMRIALLLCITWVMRLTATLFSVFDLEISGKDLILIAGGLFLLAKSTYEIHHKMEIPDPRHNAPEQHAINTMWGAVGQIMMIDVVFSLDSVITAVGMAKHVSIMIAAVVVAIVVMMIFAETVSAFIERHPTMKMLALSFLLLIGVMLVAEGLHQHINRGYIYFAMAFSLGVEFLNIRGRAVLKMRKRTAPES